MELDDILPLLARDPFAAADLAEVALLVAREEYADVDVEATLCELAAMAYDVRPRQRGPLASRVATLCRFLFHELGFRGNTSDYYDPRNSYFNQVLDRRTGLPITLALVAMSVGERAGLAVRGVGLPGHFIAKAVDGEEEVLFDPFHEGRLLTPVACELLVERVTGQRFEATEEAFTEVSPHAFTVRLLTNLKGTYLRTGEFVRAARIIRRLCQLLPDDVLQRRDLGVSLLHAGQPGRALEHLEAYLEGVPKSADEQTVRQMLRQAQNDIAKWN